LNLSWLFRVSAETARKGRERLADGELVLDAATLAGWFCVASGTDLMALDAVEQKAWRKAMKIWKGQEGQRSALHNRATLHRLMYLCQESEHRGGHLRKALELYHRLAQETGQADYRALAGWAAEELRRALLEANKAGDDDMVAKSLQLIHDSQGMVACEDLQEQLMLAEVDDLALHTATLVRELLPYQGVVHAPPRALLMDAQSQAELDVLPPAVRLAYRLVAGSRQRRRVDAMVAELCGLMAQSMFKGGEGRAGKKWQSEALRWEPRVAQEWKEPEPETLGDEAAAPVKFSEPELTDEEAAPRSAGPWWLGIHARPSKVVQHEPREEWLEAVRLLGLPVFPLRRLAVYRNLDTGELGSSQRLPLAAWHYLWMMLVVLLLGLALILMVLKLSPELRRLTAPSVPAAQRAERQVQIGHAVERLKRLAQVEADLRRSAKPDKKKLQAIEIERQALIDKVQQLEQDS
jgi:hypothetical protein